MSKDIRWHSADEFFNCSIGEVIEDIDSDIENPPVKPVKKPEKPVLAGKTPLEFVNAMNVYGDQSEAYHEYMMNTNPGLVDDVYYTRSMVRKIGDDVYKVSIVRHDDTESRGNSEEWFKNGVLHRLGGYPAYTKVFDPRIPEEAYLAEHTEIIYINGEIKKQSDLAYENILSGKPLAVRQYIGCDLNEPGM